MGNYCAPLAPSMPCPAVPDHALPCRAPPRHAKASPAMPCDIYSKPSSRFPPPTCCTANRSAWRPARARASCANNRNRWHILKYFSVSGDSSSTSCSTRCDRPEVVVVGFSRPFRISTRQLPLQPIRAKNQRGASGSATPPPATGPLYELSRGSGLGSSSAATMVTSPSIWRGSLSPGANP